MDNGAWQGRSVTLARQEGELHMKHDAPFLSSIVTVSFWHFIRNLQGRTCQSGVCNWSLEQRRAQLGVRCWQAQVE